MIWKIYFLFKKNENKEILTILQTIQDSSPGYLSDQTTLNQIQTYEKYPFSIKTVMRAHD